MLRPSRQPLWTVPTSASPRSRGLATRSLVMAAAVVITLAGGSWGVYSYTRSGNAAAGAESTRETHLVTETSFNISTTANGELEAKRQIEVRSKLDNTSTIAWIIPEGTSVKKDEVLVRLNADDLETRRIEAELQVENAKAAFVKAETELSIQERENTSNIQAAQVKLDLAVLALDQWEKGDKKQKQEDNKQAIAKAEAEHERLKEKYEKSITLEKEGFVSTDELKRDKLAYEEAVRELDKARLAQDIYDTYQIVMDGTQKRSDVEQATSELERTKQQAEIEVVSKQTARNTSKRQLEVQEQKLAKLVDSIANATLIAPADGLVVYSSSMQRDRWGGDNDGPLQIGRQIYPNQLVIVLPDTTEMVASVRIHESLQSRVRTGQKATVKIDAAGGKTFDATVESIGILAESGGFRDPNLREYTVKLSVNSEAATLKPAMRCEAEIIMGQVENAIAVPIQAVFNEGMMRYVYLPSAGKFVRRPVKVGKMSERFAEIAAGVKAGERVLLREPSPNEILDAPWNTDELALAGYKKNDDGSIARIGGGPGGPPGGSDSGPQGGPRGGAPAGSDGASTGGRNRGARSAPPASPPGTPPAAKPDAAADSSNVPASTPGSNTDSGTAAKPSDTSDPKPTTPASPTAAPAPKSRE